MSTALPTVSILLGGLALAAGLLSARRARRRKRECSRRIGELQGLWKRFARGARAEVFRQRLRHLDESTDADQPSSERARAEAAFFGACACLEDHQPAHAARLFQVAYHADPTLPTASVLAFACLKVPPHRCEELPRCSLETWRELGSPPLERSPRERLILRFEGVREILAPLLPLPGCSEQSLTS